MVFLFFGNASAQTFTLDWSKNYGGSSMDFAEQISPTSDGGFIVIGRSSSSNGDVSTNMGQSDFWLVKLDSNGNLQWQKTFVLSAARRLCRAWTHARTAGVGSNPMSRTGWRSRRRFPERRNRIGTS